MITHFMLADPVRSLRCEAGARGVTLLDPSLVQQPVAPAHNRPDSLPVRYHSCENPQVQDPSEPSLHPLCAGAIRLSLTSYRD